MTELMFPLLSDVEGSENEDDDDDEAGDPCT